MVAFGRYELEEELGRGAVGIVYRARERTTGTEVALKVLQGAGKIDETARRRFEREARLPARVRHPGIVEVLDAGTEDGVPYIALALVRGRPLASITLGLRQHVTILAKVARAVGAAHRAGVIHRDLKPTNVIVADGSGEPCVVDFGLAFDARLDASRLSRTGEIVGTPAYMAPEVFLGGAPHDPRGDVFALGMMLYEKLNGAHPMKGLVGHEVLERVADGLPDLPLHVDPFLALLARRAASRDPGRRPADGVVLAEELERWLKGDAPTIAEPPRWPRVAVGLLLAALAVAGAVLGARAVRPGKASSPGSAPGQAGTPVAATPSLDKSLAMSPAESDAIDGEIERARQLNQFEPLQKTLRGTARLYPRDSRAVHFGGIASLMDDGKELDGRRELARALTLGPALPGPAMLRTAFVFHTLGFDLAATDLVVRATGRERTREWEPKLLGMFLLLVDPPYRDGRRSGEVLAEVAVKDPATMLQRIHARFAAGDREGAAADFEREAENFRGEAPALSDELVDRARRCRAGAGSDRAAHVTLGVSLGGSPLLELLDGIEQEWRHTWDPEAAKQPAKRLLNVARTQAKLGRAERAAVIYLATARTFEAAEEPSGRLDALAKAFDAAAGAKTDVRSLAARTFARALIDTDAARAEAVAQAGVQPLAAGETEARSAAELADGWLVVAEVALARGKKADARSAIEKGLALRPFDERPFLAARASAE